MYVTVTLKDVVKRIIMLYYYDYFSFLTEKEKCWSTNTEQNDRSFITVHVFLIFSNVITSCRVC